MNIKVLESDPAVYPQLKPVLRKAAGTGEIGAYYGVKNSIETLKMESECEEQLWPSLIISEVIFKDGDIRSIYQFLRNSKLKNIPIIVYTSASDDVVTEKLSGLKIAGIVKKDPNGPEKIAQEITKALKKP